MNEMFEQMVERLTPTLKRISHRLNGHFTFFNDDDLCQEALIHLWRLFREGKLGDKTDSYILQGCYYHLKNYIRTSMDKAKIISFECPIDEDGTMLEEIIPSSEKPSSESAEDKVLFEELNSAGLEKRDMGVISMFMDGLTTREIGKKLGISHVAVVKLRNKIREKCKDVKRKIGEGYQN